MATKPYPPIEEAPAVVNEPAVAYQRTDPSTYHGTAPFEPDNELRPFTWDEAQKEIAEAEKEDSVGTSSEDFFAELKEEFPWLL